ncbi:sialidase-1 [Salegentibacter holothuriorum]|uniref:exo-alpha-sialidase n=1 Tax=Salegentibacter holothuriorum TaxID=241145 RepID=A0A1T5DH59_9FLAO|nr:sialidase family protein [Salegentibacter holothuriorum]SKB70967.1 sialidase-1 [Salegentibacter holothuriorum]
MKSFFLLLGFSLSWLLSSSQSESKELPNGLKAINLFSALEGDGIACYRIPSLITAINGDLIAAIDQRVPSCGDLRYNENINIVIRRSTNNGKRWSDIETIVDFPLGISASDPSMILDEKTGNIFLFYNFMNHNNDTDVYYFHVIKSADNGKTWSSPRDITSEITKEEWHKDFKFITSGSGIQTNSGRLLHTLVNHDKGLHLFGSDNHGESWFFIDSQIKPANESKVVELKDGEYMVNSRVKTGEGLRYVHISGDEGKTWATKPEPQLPDPVNNAALLNYNAADNKTRLLFSNTKSSENRENLNVRISYDEGKTWSEGKTIYAGSAAYSDLTVLENGDIGIFFEADGYSRNLFTSFSLEWLTDK